MKLYPSFKQWYDHCQSWDQESTPSYVRECSLKSFPYEEGGFSEVRRLLEWGNELIKKKPLGPLDLSPNVYGIGGSLYLVIGETLWDRRGYVHNLRYLGPENWNPNQKLQLFPWNLPQEMPAVKASRSKFIKSKRLRRDLTNWEKFRSFSETYPGHIRDTSPFISLRVPVFQAYSPQTSWRGEGRKLEIILNSPLPQGIMPPYEVWQEIDQALSNHLVERPDPIESPDKVKITKKGFTDASFRRSKEAK